MTPLIRKHSLCLFVLLSLFSFTTQAAPISGVISLPNGELASGNMLISISATDTNGGQPFNFVNVSIPSGQNSVAFTLPNIPADPSATWRIRYSCFTTSVACLDYVLVGYYDTGAAGNLNYKEAEATTVAQGTSGVNFTVLEGVNITGSLTSPLGAAPADGIDVLMFFTSTDFSVSDSIRYEIAEANSSVDFDVHVPDDANLDYLVRYSCDTAPAASDNCTDFFLSNGYYQSSAANNTVNNAGDAQSLDGDMAHANIDMELLPGASISGTISRIASTSTANEVSLFVSASDQTGGAASANTIVVIPTAQSSVDYNVIVDPSDTSNWTISAFCNSGITSAGCADYSANSYYDSDTPITNSSGDMAAADVLAGNTVHTDIDFTLVQAKTISGEIMLPDAQSAPVGGIDLFVTAQQISGETTGPNSANASATILAGHNSVAYSVSIPDVEDAQWRVSINCDASTTPGGCALITPSIIFYDVDNAPSNSSIFEADADLVTGTGNITSINMTLITAALASGEIFLDKEGVAPNGDLIVRMRGRGYILGEPVADVFHLVTIPAGQNSTPYSLGLTQLEDIVWTIEIECDATNPAATCSAYSPKSYYADTVPETTTSPNAGDATFIDPSLALDTINLTLLADNDELCVPISTNSGRVILVCL